MFTAKSQGVQHVIIMTCSQIVFILSIVINRVTHVCITVIIKRNYILMCKNTFALNIILNYTWFLFYNYTCVCLLTYDEIYAIAAYYISCGN